MKVIHKLKEQFHDNEPIVLTIGFFDGMHLGHQKIFSHIKKLCGSSGYTQAITFSNHPKTLLNPLKIPPLISPVSQRIKLFEKEGVETLFLIPFDEKIKNLSADNFIAEIKDKTSFTDLVLGFDARIGKDKEGDEKLLLLLSKKYNYKLHIIEPHKIGKVTVSSSLVRQKIQEGDFEEVKKLLGRIYSIYSKITEGRQLGQQMGFPTINLEVEDLCLPPLGVYKVSVNHNGKMIQGAANLGFAPTVQKRTSPILEVHLLENYNVPYNEYVEVTFHNFIREEKKFHSIDELKAQIEKDILQIKGL